jgi:hypothetical protein
MCTAARGTAVCKLFLKLVNIWSVHLYTIGMARNIKKSVSQKGDATLYWWVRQHDTFSVEVLCIDRHYETKLAFLADMRYSWCLYITVNPENPLYAEVAPYNEGDDYCCTSELINAHMHGGVTFKDRENDNVRIGCDFSHYVDKPYQRTPPSDPSCHVHLFADSLESFVLEASGKEPTLKPEDWAGVYAITEWELKHLFVSLLSGEHPFKPNVLFL